MGSGISSADVATHIENQAKLVSQLQSVVEWQSQAINRLMTYNECDPSMEAVAKDDGGSVIADENHKVVARKEEKAITAAEKSAPNALWKEPTEEEERNFMATKPWLGAMAMPTGFAYGKTDGLPDVVLELEHVHGYRTSGCRNNIAYVDASTIVYFAAGVGIVHDLPANKQHFFRGHADDILCLAYHAGKGLVATGEIGAAPKLCVWDVKTGTPVATYAAIHKRGVVSCSFSADGSKVATVGLDDDHMVAVHDVATGALLSSSKGDSERILDIQCNMTKEADSNNEWVTVGVKHIKFWALVGSTLKGTRGLLGTKGEQKGLLTVAFTTQFTVAGTTDGELYVFKKNQLYKTVDAHQKHLFALKAVGDTLYSGGKDGYLSKWNMSNFAKTGSVNLNKAEDPAVMANASNAVRAIDVLDDNNILVGTQTNSIYSVDFASLTTTPLIATHYGDLSADAGDKEGYGELWGLNFHPKSDIFATSCEDKTLRLWNVRSRTPVGKILLKENAISVAWAPDGKQLAVGFKNGGIQIISYENGQLEEDTSFKKRSKRIQCLSYSPNGKVLAVGSADNLIDIYAVSAGTYKLQGTCKGNSSTILHVDFDVDSKYIQSCAQSYELLFYETATGNQLTKSRDLKDTVWATFTSILGWDVQGIWPAEADGSDINAVAKSHNGKYLATAEDSGTVKLFNYPCVGGGLDKTGRLTRRPESNANKGHSSHVTNVSWKSDDTYLVSVGGADMAIFQWKVVKA